MKRILIIFLTMLPCLALAQSVVISHPLELLPNSQAVIQFNNIFGNWENKDLDDTFPYVVVQMHLSGDENAVMMAKQKINLDLGTMYKVEAVDRNQLNKILFLVPKGVRIIYLLCGEGCERQQLYSGSLIENKVYNCTVTYNPPSNISSSNSDAIMAQMKSMQEQMQRMQEQNAQMQQLLQNQQNNPSQSQTSGQTKQNIAAAQKENANRDKEEVAPKVVEQLEPTQVQGMKVANGVLKKVPKKFLGHFVVGNDITEIGKNAFKECSLLEKVTIPNSVTCIGSSAFFWCSHLLYVNMPDHLDDMGRNSFYMCQYLKKVVLPEGLQRIAEGAFGWCTSLDTINIPSSVRTIEYGAFMWCVSLRNVTIPEGVENINVYAFKFCQNLESITLPNSLKHIGANAFGECNKLAHIYVPKGSADKFRMLLSSEFWSKIEEK